MAFCPFRNLIHGRIGFGKLSSGLSSVHERLLFAFERISFGSAIRKVFPQALEGSPLILQDFPLTWEGNIQLRIWKSLCQVFEESH